MNSSTPTIYAEITARLAAVRRKQHVAAVIRGSLISAFVVLCTVLVALVIEQLLYLDVLLRTALFYAIILIGVGLLAWRVGPPLLRRIHILREETDLETARQVGLHFPSINDHLVNILDLFPEREQTTFYSAELIDASFEDARKEIEPLDFRTIVDYTGSRRMSKLIALALGVAVLLFGVFPSAFLGSASRLLKYNQSFAAPVALRFVVDPGDEEVVKGATVRVRVRIEGESRQQIVLAQKPEGQLTYEETTLNLTPEGVFQYEFHALKATTYYYVMSGAIRSREFSLTVTDRPIIRMLRVQLVFPSYAKLASRLLDDNIGDVAALRGTKVGFSIETNKPLAAANLVFSDSTGMALVVAGSKATGQVVLMKDRTYHVLLKDSAGIANSEPIEYTMKVIPDAYPSVAIMMPGTNLDLAENVGLNMLFKITDDYGFTSLRLAHKLTQSRYEKPATGYSFTPIPIPEGTRTEALVPYLWSLEGLHLVPEDAVSYYVEVFDNDNVSGPKSATSEIFTLRLPSLDEVFSDVDKSHEVSVDALQQALKESQQAKKGLDELQQEMKKNPEKMNWEDQKKAEELVKKYDELQKRMDDVNKTVEQMVNEMQKNQVLSKETLEKYQELQHMMEQMNSPEFAEAMKKLQQAMAQVNPEALKQALQQFNFSEENFRKSIERTLNLLKRIQIEQKVDETLRRTEELQKKQEDIQKQTEQTRPEDRNKLNELADQQRDLKEQLEKLQKELADLQKKMEEFPTEMPLSEMEKARDSLEQSQLDEQMEKIAQELQQQQTQPAMQNQKQAMQKMGQLMQQLKQMKQSMQQNQQRQIVNEMRRALQDLLELSKRQEALKNESHTLDPNSQRFRENAQQQMDILRDLGAVTSRLSQLSQKTFGVTPEMGKSIGDAMREMNNALQSLEQRNGSVAGQQQGSAMSSLNAAAQQVQGAMNAMMQGEGQGMGMAGFMQRLQQMSGMQKGINQGTQNLGGMSPQQAAEMARLAGQQGMVRKSLEQLAKEAANAGQLSKMLGDLNRIAQDMREVQTDLAQGNVNPETLRKQERILSRLLDSQRSARERDYEKKRRAESGTEITRRSPGAIDLTTQEGRTRLRQDLLKAMEEGYAKDYEELIKKYFEALENSEQRATSQ